MKLDLQLYVRRHRNGFFTVRVLGDRHLELYTDDLDQAREDLELLVSDIVERSHPTRQSSFSTAGGAETEVLEVPDLFTVHAEDEAIRVPGRFTTFVSGHSWHNAWIPRLDLHVFAKRRRRGWQDDAASLVKKHLQRLDEGAQIAHRLDAEEWVEVLPVTADPPPLTRFIGKHRHLDELPLAADEAEERERTRRPDGKPPRPPTPTLARIGVNLGEQARAGDLERAVERRDVIDQLTAMLTGKRRQAVAVIGPPGVGKSTILNEVAHRIAHQVEDPADARPVFFVDASRLVAGENWFGDWQRQTLDVLEECEVADVVWFVGSLLPLLDAGKNIASEQNVAMLMKPALAGRRLTLVGECSTAAWSQLSLLDAGFARLFAAFRIDEPEPEEGRRILAGVAKERAETLELDIQPAALEATSELSRRYASTTSPLGAAAHLLRRVAEAAAADDVQRLDRSAVVRHFCAETGLPEFLVRDELPLPQDKIRAAFARRLIGQELAVSLMTDLVTVIKAGLSDLGRPLGSFLFVGPTGVGKTETAKALASFLFGTDQRLTRFDMSEFSGWDAVTRFLGSRDEEGKLVAAVRRRPFSVVLLDEIEKASPAIFDLLLQVLGEARLTDEAGRSADFKNVVVIMTSNLGVDTLKRAVGFDAGSLADRYKSHFLAEAQRFFRPELFNRIDHIVPFLPLGAPAIREITAREIDKFLGREGLRQRKVELQVADTVLPWLAERGVDERYGARPLKRVIERRLTSPLARALADSSSEQPRTIAVRPDGDGLAFESRPSRTRVAEGERTLAGLIERVQSLRFRHRSWCHVPAYREAEQRLRLIERLSQMKRFWEDRALADARLAGVKADRQLVEAMTEVGQRIDSLDDLVHDAYFSRDSSTAAELEAERGEILQGLVAQELALQSRGLEQTDAVTLFLTPGQNAERFLERLFVTYAELARDRDWQLKLELLFLQETEPAPEPPTPAKSRPRSRKANKGRPPPEDEPPSPPSRKKKALKHAPPTVELRFRRGRADVLDEDDDEVSLRRAAGRFLNRAHEDDTVVMFIEGPHAATMLLAEAGQHHRIDADTTSVVTVRARPGAGRVCPSRDFLQTVLPKIRVVDDRRGQIDDLPSGLHFPEEPRLWRVYERFMRARPLLSAFGADGGRWFRLWEGH